MLRTLCLVSLLLLSMPSCMRRGGQTALPTSCECSSGSGPTSPEGLYAKIEREMGKNRAKMAQLNAAKSQENLLQCIETAPCAPAEAAELILRMKKGAVEIKGGSPRLCESNLSYLNADVPPKVTYCFYDGIQHVEVLALDDHGLWEIDLGAQTPVGVHIDAQGGIRDLNFRHVLLNQLNVEAQSGASILNIMGGQPYLQSVDCHQAYGSIALNAEGDYPSMKSLSISTGHGDISGIFTGYYARLDEMTISTTGGNMALDLTGAWKRICRIRITCTDGDCLLWIPRGVGASVKVIKAASGTVDMGEMEKKWSPNAYLNEAYGKTKAYLDIEVRSTDGNVKVVQFTG